MTDRNPIDNSTRAQLGEIMAAAMQAHQGGALFEADLLYAEALAIDPEHLQALRLSGILARERGELGKSLTLLKRAHTVAPSNPLPLNEIALTEMAAGELQAAESSLRSALNLDPFSARTLTNLGALSQHRGHLQAAIDFYRQALEQQPGDLEVQCNLAKALSDAGQTETALTVCSAASDSSDGHAAALATRGAILLEARRYTDALVTLIAATKANPSDDMALVNLAMCRYMLGDKQAARVALQQAVAVNPYNARAVADLANCLSAVGADDAALELCTDFLQRHPGERLVVAAHALALLNAGQVSSARELTDCTTLVKIRELPSPPGFASLAAFNAELATFITHDASLLDNPVSKSTYGGAQTGELNLAETPCLVAFANAIRGAIKTAADEWQAAGLSGHPVLTPATRDWTIRAWGTVLRAGGQQIPHMHPLGWLSGVYYVQLPPAMTTPDAYTGWLEFGMPPERFFRRCEPDVARFEPLPGRLLLFPSWLWHQTLPFQANGERISIAFDVIPTGACRLFD